MLSSIPTKGELVMHSVDEILSLIDQKSGEEEYFFHQVKRDLIQNIVEIVDPIWPTTVVLKVRRLASDPEHLRAICLAILHSDEHDHPPALMTGTNGVYEVPFVRKRVSELNAKERQLVRDAAERFLESTNTSNKVAHIKKIGSSIALAMAL